MPGYFGIGNGLFKMFSGQFLSVSQIKGYLSKTVRQTMDPDFYDDGRHFSG